MVEQEIKDLIRARGRVQASLTRIQTFVQQYEESQDVLNIKLPCALGSTQPLKMSTRIFLGVKAAGA